MQAVYTRPLWAIPRTQPAPGRYFGPHIGRKNPGLAPALWQSAGVERTSTDSDSPTPNSPSDRDPLLPMDPFTAEAAAKLLSSEWHRDGAFEWRVVRPDAAASSQPVAAARQRLTEARPSGGSCWFSLGDVFELEWRPAQGGAGEDAGAASEQDPSARARAFLDEFWRWALDESAPKKSFSRAPDFKPAGMPSFWQRFLDFNPHAQHEISFPVTPAWIFEQLTLDENMGLSPEEAELYLRLVMEEQFGSGPPPWV